MAITLADYTNLSSSSVASSFTVPVPAATADGDLLIFQATTKENPWTALPPHAGLIANSGGPAVFTDLIMPADGYTEVGSVRVVILGPNPAALPRHFWWLGWKIASSEPASYAINSLTGTSSGCQANILTFKGVSSVTPLGNQESDPAAANSFPLPLVAINDRNAVPVPGSTRWIAMDDGSGNNTACQAYQLMLEGSDLSEELYVFGNQSQLSASFAVGGDAGTFGPPGMDTVLSILQGVAGLENFFVLKLAVPVIAASDAVFRIRFRAHP